MASRSGALYFGGWLKQLKNWVERSLTHKTVLPIG
jgi:hypothetical protein